MYQEKKEKDCIDSSMHGLEGYIKKTKERLITATSNTHGNKRTTERRSAGDKLSRVNAVARYHQQSSFTGKRKKIKDDGL